MKKMEEFFNLPPVVSEVEEVPEVDATVTRDVALSQAQEVYNSLSTAEKVDMALSTVVDLDKHDSEMDAIANKAINTFEDLISLGANVPDVHAGKIYEVAGQMLKTALDAKNSKTERKLKMIELQLKKIKAEQADPEGGSGRNGSGTDFDRNELLKHFITSKQP